MPLSRKFVLVLTTLLACSFPLMAEAADNSIVPGKRIGRVSIGETSEEVHRDLGRSDSGDAAMGHSLETWFSSGISADKDRLDIYMARDFSRKGEPLTVRQIRVTSSAFATAGGMTIGRRLSDIRRSFKGIKPVAYYFLDDRTRVYIYDDVKNGLAFEVPAGVNGRLPTATSPCIAIVVHAKGTSAVDQYIPVHPNLNRL